MAQRPAAKSKKSKSTDPDEVFRTTTLGLLGANIRERREQLMNQEAFAAEAGLARGYYGSVERGEHNTAVVNLCKIAMALSCEPGELLPSLNELRKAAGKS